MADFKLKIVIPYVNPFWLTENHYRALESIGYKLPGIWPKTIESINDVVAKYNTTVEPIQGAIISDNREIGVRDFNDYDYVLFVDSDISFKIEDFERLLSYDIDFVSGVYLVRDTNAYSYFVGDVPQTGIGLDCLIPADYCGLGFSLIKTKVFKYLKTPFFGGVHEDKYFCNNLRKNGVDIKIDTGCVVNHNYFSV